MDYLSIGYDIESRAGLGANHECVYHSRAWVVSPAHCCYHMHCLLMNFSRRWAFYIAAIVLTATTCCLFALRESRPSLFPSHEAAMIRENTGLDDLQALNPDFTPDFSAFVHMALFRPARLFFTEPIICMVAVISAVAAAIVYLFTVALPTVYEQFGFSAESASLPFLAIGLGLILSVFTRILDDRIVARLQRQGRPLTPEDKLLGFTIWYSSPRMRIVVVRVDHPTPCSQSALDSPHLGLDLYWLCSQRARHRTCWICGR